MISYMLTKNEQGKQLTVYIGEESYNFYEIHPRFTDVLLEIEKENNADIELIKEWATPPKTKEHKLEYLSYLVSVENDSVLFDGTVLNGLLSETILKLRNLGKDIKPYVLFLEKLMTNPVENSRHQLYSWLEKHGLVITQDGNFLAYKGVKSNYGSINTGFGIVNGVTYDNASLDNKIGNVIEMPRSMVQHDTSVACAVGLHAGTLSYARGWAGNGKVVLVEISPADVASVPRDCDTQKIRMCRYKVIQDWDSTGEINADEYYDSFDDDYDDSEELVEDTYEEVNTEFGLELDQYMYMEFFKWAKQHVKDNYNSEKSKIASSYQQLFERFVEDTEGLYDEELLSLLNDTVYTLDMNLDSNALYAYHILRTDINFDNQLL